MENNESFASPKEETPASKEKPDFEKMAKDCQEYKRLSNVIPQQVYFVIWSDGYKKGGERIWNDHVEPRDRQIAALQEEIRQLKEEKKFPRMMEVRDEGTEWTKQEVFIVSRDNEQYDYAREIKP